MEPCAYARSMFNVIPIADIGTTGVTQVSFRLRRVVVADHMLRLLDTFSGIGGFSYAAERIVGGYKTVAFVEREPFCQKILQKHWPSVPIYGDITAFNPEPYSADVVCGGFPCQDISTAGKQAGIKEGTRSGLFYELIRVVRLVRPQYVILENVSAILANGLDTVLGELAQAGFDAEWACIPASAVGACHQRDRWWLIAYASGGAGFQRQTEQAEHIDQGGGSRLSMAQPRDPHCEALPAANTNNQRQQEQQLATIAGGSGRFSWGDAPRRLNPDWRGYLSKPVLCRGDDGLSGRVDRLKALGNAVVPQVAAIPLQRVLDLSTLL
nr:methyltransferase [uncultured Mediterranean phage uvMED]